MNLLWFRQNNAGQKCLDLLRRYPDAPLVDQEALNAICCSTSKALPSSWGAFGCQAFANGTPKSIHYPGHNPWRLIENNFPDYIESYNIWFRYANFIFRKKWTYYCDKKKFVKYGLMRILGISMRLFRNFFDYFTFIRVPFLSRYVNRHYASKKSWKDMMMCMKKRSDWPIR